MYSFLQKAEKNNNNYIVHNYFWIKVLVVVISSYLFAFLFFFTSFSDWILYLINTWLISDFSEKFNVLAKKGEFSSGNLVSCFGKTRILGTQPLLPADPDQWALPRVVKLINGNDRGFVNDDLRHNQLQSSNNRCHAAVLQYHGVLSHTYKCTWWLCHYQEWTSSPSLPSSLPL